MSSILKSVKLDFNIAKSRYFMFIIDIIGVFFAVMSKIPMYGALIIMVVSTPIAGQIFSVYEKNNLENLYGILPLKKSDVVIGRHLYALCLIVINGIIATLVAYIVSIVTGHVINSNEFLTLLSFGFAYACLMTAVIFPLYFKFSFSKVYIFSNLPFYLLFVILFVLTRKTNLLQQAGPAVQNLTSSLTAAAVGLGLGLVLLALSCILSMSLVEGNQPRSLPAEEPAKRLFFADNLRTWVVILVVLQHLAEVYSTLYLFMMINSAYFMGLLFLLSGYFTPGAYERKGPGKFLMDRLLRLAIPTLVYVFIISPLMVWGRHQITHQPIGNLFVLDQMWFVVMLLIFDLGYLVWRTIVKNRPERPAGGASKKLTFSKVALFTLALAAASYLLRIVIPYGIPVLEFPSLGYLAQYLSFFLIGMLAFRQGWLRSIPGSLGQLGFVLAILASVILFPVSVIGSNSMWIGYGSWQSAVFALWDSIFAVGISLALITFFRRFLDGGKKFGRFLSQHSFAVYVIHVPVIVFLVPALSGLQALPQLKFLLAAVVCLPVCFGLAWLVRKIPFAKRVL
ncbi:acyltransferase family protein [Desulfosporosinus sp. PR]|uniref:acyltransferase family protein n=1 Tax=Candidatus Desulfosporosinus nitrosoreducens TaxID=3401928 RepID=UPI0027E88368|nr:acyltransferase family protein [Desulfosporosinus sp. PR]MDQ7096578.1 acyltransferase family protein [Desulfosporosinus sp. PR]